MAFADDDERVTEERQARRRPQPVDDDDDEPVVVARRSRQSDRALSADDKQWGMFCHLSALAGFLVPGGNFIGPIICWMVKKDTSRFVDEHGKESVNFQICMMIYAFICAVTIIGIPLVFLVGIYGLIMPIIAGLEAQKGNRYEYQMIFRLIK
jgi:hypothetical protein